MRLLLNSDWRTRGYLPHFDPPGGRQHIIFRLNDALSAGALARIRTAPTRERLLLAEAALDAGHGSLALADPWLAEIVASALVHFDGERYGLLSWCVMPTHVHLLIQRFPAWPIPGLVRTWKSFTARRANARLGGGGRFCAREYFDRTMRTDEQTERTAAYIEANPVAAGLCVSPSDWRWSSARHPGAPASRPALFHAGLGAGAPKKAHSQSAAARR